MNSVFHHSALIDGCYSDFNLQFDLAALVLVFVFFSLHAECRSCEHWEGPRRDAFFKIWSFEYNTAAWGRERRRRGGRQEGHYCWNAAFLTKQLSLSRTHMLVTSPPHIHCGNKAFSGPCVCVLGGGVGNTITYASIYFCWFALKL